MPITIIWDQVADAEATQHAREGVRVVRCGLVKGLTTANTTASRALLDAAGMSELFPELAIGYEHPDLSGAYLVARQARGIVGTNGTMARVWAYFETPSGLAAPINAYAVRDMGQLMAEPSDVFPGTAQQLRCSLGTSSPDYDSDDDDPEDRPITVNWPRNARIIQVYGEFTSRPPIAILNAGNTVNDDEWQGRGPGYWRAEPPDAAYSARTGLTSVSMTVMSKGVLPGEDWSTYEIPIDPTTGHRAKVKESIIQTLYDQEYAYGVRNDKNAIWKGGLYKTSDFENLFGAELV